MKNFQLKGIDNVMQNLNEEILKMKGRTMSGFIDASKIIRRSMDKTSPKIPVGVTGNLRGSWFTTSFYTPQKEPRLAIGFTASYAVYVHEREKGKRSGLPIRFNRFGAGPKFLEQSISRNKDLILEAIRRRAKV